ncbi:unnamed protein product [Caenorhabditis auriculariae]|uniref:WASH complex subunit 7 n=1 Tax=Caenorhabditis auriculariae TaxID=2777116 RepID=A0A8S1HUP1_9PELO|nr:unnamed protein product [Caenorhabditis auriculariae]
MEQSKSGRARFYEQNKRRDILHNIPDFENSSNDDTVIFEDECSQRIDISAMIVCDHPLVEGFLRTLCSLIDKSDIAVNTAIEELWPSLLLYAETALQKSEQDEYAAIAQVSSFVGFLKEMFDFANTSLQLFRNLIQQIRLFHQIDPNVLNGTEKVHLRKAWRSLGELLAIFVQLDELISSRGIIKSHVSSYIRTLETTLHNPTQFGTTFEKLSESVSVMHEIERFLLSGNSLRYCYEQTLGDLDMSHDFADRMYAEVSDMFARWEKAAAEDIPDKRFLLSITSLTVYYHMHFANFAKKKLAKAVWTSHKKILSFHLLGDIIFVPCELLLRELADTSLTDKKTIAIVQQARQTLRSATHVEGMLAEADAARLEVEGYVLEVENEIRNRSANAGQVAASSLRLSQTLLKGVRLADTMTRLLKTALNGFDGEHKMTKRLAFTVFGVVEAVKELTRLFSSNWRSFSEAAAMSSQQWRCHVLSLLEQARQTLRENVATTSSARENALSVAMASVLHSASRPRTVVCAVALEIACIEELLCSTDLKQLYTLLNRIETLTSSRKLVSRVTNCSFLLHNKPLIALFWETALKRKPSIEAIDNFCSAISDCAQLCAKSRHGGTSSEGISTVLDAFLNESFEMLRKGLLAPLCGVLENDLRILTHKHLQIESSDRLSMEENFFLRQLLKNPRLQIYTKVVDIREFVARYLERTFYNLTVVAPHDSNTYLRMADLASQKYDIDLIDGQLQRGGIDETLDVVQVTRHLSSFVTQYNYCLNLQLFIEKESPNKSLRVLSKEQMTASLRKHGTGVLATSVNIAYQVLRKKLNVFHQFLSDEHIRAHLHRDARYFEENREDLNKLYPMKRAEKFSRAISRLGMAAEDQTYIDKFRELVAQIGNTLGYVRTMTSSAAAVHSELRDYADDEDMSLLMDGTSLVEDENAIESEKAVRTLCDALNELHDQGDKSKDFSKMLVEVFNSSLSTSPQQFGHLGLFYIVVPALTMCHVEHMLTNRERLQRRAASNKEITFTDDGFALGVAYLLSVLGVWPRFNSLNWFRSVLRTLEEEKAEQETLNARESRGAHLKISRLQAYEREFRLLLFTFQSAGVFFSFDSAE